MITEQNAERFCVLMDRLEAATDLDSLNDGARTDLDEILDCPCDSCRDKLLELHGVCLQSNTD